MRLLWQRYGRTGTAEVEQTRADEARTLDESSAPVATGLAEDGFGSLLTQATGLDLSEALAAWVDNTGDLPLAELLAVVGVRVSFEASATDPPSLGIWTTTRGSDLLIKTAIEGGAAMRAGLHAGDVLVSIDHLRVNEHNWARMLRRKRPGDRVTIHIFRHEELRAFEVCLEPPRAEKATLSIEPTTAGEAQRLAAERRLAWLAATHAS